MYSRKNFVRVEHESIWGSLRGSGNSVYWSCQTYSSLNSRVFLLFCSLPINHSASFCQRVLGFLKIIEREWGCWSSWPRLDTWHGRVNSARIRWAPLCQALTWEIQVAQQVCAPGNCNVTTGWVLSEHFTPGASRAEEVTPQRRWLPGGGDVVLTLWGRMGMPGR